MIRPMSLDSWYRMMSDCQEGIFRELARTASRACVVSIHRSRSVVLPVVALAYPNGACVQIRDNFFDIKVSVTSPVDVDLPEGVCGDERIEAVYCEGFPEGTVLPRHADSPRVFTVSVPDSASLARLLAAVRVSSDRSTKAVEVLDEELIRVTHGS